MKVCWLPALSIAAQASVYARLGETLYFGDAPEYAGYYQVNVRVPKGITPGPAVPVHITYFDRPSNEVTVAVQ